MRYLTLLIRVLLLAGCAGLRSVSHAAETAEPVVFLQKATTEVLDVAYAPGTAASGLQERIRPVLERFFAFDGMTRRAVGPGWREFKADEQRRTTELFAVLIIRTYSQRFDPALKPEIKFGKASELDRGRREVPSTVTYKGGTYSVVYRLEPVAGSWRVYDVVVEGVSLVANYRAQFESLFNKGGAAEVIRSLETSIANEPKP